MELVDSYRRARAEHPMLYDGVLQTWTLFCHKDIVTALKNQKALSSRWPTSPPIERITQFNSLKDEAAKHGGKLADFVEMIEDGRKEFLLAADHPRHTILRTMLASSFAPNAAQALIHVVQKVFRASLDLLPARGEFDFSSHLADPVSLGVVGHLLSLTREQLLHLARLSDNVHFEWHSITVKQACHAVSCEEEIREFFKNHLNDASAANSGSLTKVLLRALDSGLIGWDEAVGLCREVIVAGSGTTRFTLSSAMVELCRRKELQDVIRADRTRIPEFLNEVSRLQPPLHGLFRRVLEPIPIGNHIFEAGSTLFLNYASANRDETAYEDADCLQLGRVTGDRHLTFGAGRHTCIGKFVAQMVMRETINLVLDNFRHLKLSSDTTFGAGFFGDIYTLPIVFERV